MQHPGSDNDTLAETATAVNIMSLPDQIRGTRVYGIIVSLCLLRQDRHSLHLLFCCTEYGALLDTVAPFVLHLAS